MNELVYDVSDDYWKLLLIFAFLTLINIAFWVILRSTTKTRKSRLILALPITFGLLTMIPIIIQWVGAINQLEAGKMPFVQGEVVGMKPQKTYFSRDSCKQEMNLKGLEFLRVF